MTRALRNLPEPLTESLGHRTSTPAAGLILGTLSIAVLGAVLMRWRQTELRHGPPPAASGRPDGDVANEVTNHLSAIRGHCEVARIKAEGGDTLKRHMDAAIETADEMVALLRKLLAP